MIRSSLVFLFIGSSLIFLGIALTGLESLLGLLIGYILSFIFIQILYRDTIQSVELDLNLALRRMRRSFLTRWGLITLAVAVVGRFKTEWLLTLAVGIAVGLLVYLLVSIIEVLKDRRG